MMVGQAGSRGTIGDYRSTSNAHKMVSVRHLKNRLSRKREAHHFWDSTFKMMKVGVIVQQ
eukprot:scaffold8_cov142-Skeletonema_marinoi.AAC.15